MLTVFINLFLYLLAFCSIHTPIQANDLLCASCLRGGIRRDEIFKKKPFFPLLISMPSPQTVKISLSIDTVALWPRAWKVSESSPFLTHHFLLIIKLGKEKKVCPIVWQYLKRGSKTQESNTFRLEFLSLRTTGILEPIIRCCGKLSCEL